MPRLDEFFVQGVLGQSLQCTIALCVLQGSLTDDEVALLGRSRDRAEQLQSPVHCIPSPSDHR